MKNPTTTVFRAAGIIFSVFTLLNVIDVFFINIDAFKFLLNHDDLKHSLFFILLGALYTTSFLFALFATGTAALFAGKNGFTQSVWNCSVYSLVTLGLYASIKMTFQLESTEQQFLLLSMFFQFVFCIIILSCLKEESYFNFKNILPFDANTKLCLKIYGIMLVIIETASFIFAHIIED